MLGGGYYKITYARDKWTRKDEVMKNSMKKFLALSVCACMLMSGTAYAQESSIDGQETSALKAQGTETNAEEQKQDGAVNPEGQTQKEEPKAQEEQKVQEEQKDETKAGEKKAKVAKQANALAAGDVAINEANFPDAKFRGYVNDFDTDGDGNLSASEISAVTEIRIIMGGISDLTGIEYFTGLEELVCTANRLTSLDVSKNVNLSTLTCDENQLTSLDVSKNVNLWNLDCMNNQLTSLDVSQNADLRTLYCGGNKLTSLDVSKHMNLEVLGCNSNQLTSLDVSKNVDLWELWCSNNSLTGLDISKNINLKELNCDGNKLTSLDAGKNVNLEELQCFDNQLTSLDVSKNAHLTQLVCFNNQLTSLSVSTNVTSILCYNNKLTSLDVSRATNLIGLACDNNQLKALDVSKNADLGSLECSGNQLKTLDVSKTVNLANLDCHNNKLTSLDVRNCTELTYLDVRPLPKSAVQYTKEPEEFYYGEGAAVDVSTKINASEIKAQTSGINTGAICKAFNIDEDADVEVVVEQKDASPANQRRVMDYAGKYGDRVIKVYEIVMNLYEDGEHKATVTDNFGRLTLSLYAGKEYAGKTVTVYQLHGTNEIIPYRDLTVDENGMVTITVSKLSTFAVALQNTDGGASPKTGDTANMAVWIVLAVLAMSAIPITIGRKQRR